MPGPFGNVVGSIRYKWGACGATVALLLIAKPVGCVASAVAA
jgi:hypothetical protein